MTASCWSWIGCSPARPSNGSPLPYVTFYQQQRGDGLVMVDARSGNLAQAIGKSIANPFIFRNLDVVAAGQIDPGGDRVAMTPVYDACRVFPGRRIIALNVTGQPAFVAGVVPARCRRS